MRFFGDGKENWDYEDQEWREKQQKEDEDQPEARCGQCWNNLEHDSKSEKLVCVNKECIRCPETRGGYSEWFVKADELFGEGKFEEALKYFEKEIQLNPNNAEAWSGKSSAQHSIGRTDEAMDSANKSIKLDSSIKDGWNDKAGILCSLEKYSEAITCYDEALKIEPDNAQLLSNKGSALCYLGKYEESLKCLDRAIQLNPNNPEFQKNREGLEQVKKMFKQIQENGITESDLDDNFARFSWQSAEDLVGKLFEKKNYTVTIGVPTSDGGIKRQGDFGIDVEAKNGTEYLGIQVKHWGNDVGFEDVAKTLGVAQKFNKVIIVSTKSGFTSQARKHADDNPYLIELWDSNKFKDELRNYLLK
jgi:tetratricopeptide (TPR) repeat protein